MSSKRTKAGAAMAAAAALAAILPATGVASATKVNIRVEGSSRKLYEGPVNALPVVLKGNRGSYRGSYPCDVAANGGKGGKGASPVAALAATRLRLGLKWFPDLSGFMVETVSGELPPVSRGLYWDFFVNGKGTEALGYPGGCQLALKRGDSVVWAVTDGSEPLLSLRASGAPGSPRVTLRVANAASGAPVAGALVGGAGGPVTGADGRATVERPARGSRRLWASRAGAIRSNTVVVKARR